MQSIRVRLATYYSLALTATMAAFGAAVYWERTTTAPREAELQLDRALQSESNSAIQVLRQQARLLSPAERFTQTGLDTLISGAQPYLNAMADYVFVVNPRGGVVYSSPTVQSLSEISAVQISSLLLRRPLQTGIGDLNSGANQAPLRFVLTAIDSVDELGGVLVAARRDVGSSDLQQMLLSMLMMAPLILVTSGALGYWLAGRSLRPVEVMIEELGDIQDGTSLNRRLAVPHGEDELSRLAQKLNDMLGRVERSFVALRRFTADASHELKTPLMVLRAGVERSLTHPRTPGEIVPALDETLRQVNQMSELVTNLLTLARADEGRASLALVDTDLRTLLAEAAETAEILGTEREVSVKVEQPPYAVILPLDAGRIRQLLMNLVTNAVRYTPPGGSATLRIVDGAGTVTVAVQDTGIGIAPGDLPNVFERFWRADPARSRTGEHPGTGLGLAISKWIVEAHGGTISAQSRPGRGTTFTVVFPKPVTAPDG
ncbi:MAG TPA: ATP-binding protein [Gemmatimonadales bacterium]|jgi:heavy metal sensor kinase